MNTPSSDNDWVWILRKGGHTIMNVTYGDQIGGLAWPWLVGQKTTVPIVPAWGAELPARSPTTFADWTFIRASRAEAEALIAMARAEAAMKDA